jgi:D-glycero-alpha-D-manno-heptose 1-phosphate guanylyltransferase
MAPVEGQPFLSYLFDYWIGQGIRRFIVSTGHLANVIESYFGNNYRSATVAYVRELSPLGTGGALRYALECVNWESELVLMANGDTWFPANLQQLFADAVQQGSPITLALKKLEKNERYGGVAISKHGQITDFGVTTNGPSLINAGCYLLNVSAIKKALAHMPDTFSLESEFLVPFASNGMVGSSVQDQPFLDIGIPEDYRRASEFLL